MISWAWAELTRDFTHPCNERYEEEGNPENIKCQFIHSRICEFIEVANRNNAKVVRPPRSWMCLPYLRNRTEKLIKDSITNNIDPLRLIFKKNNLADRVKNARKKYLAKQTEDLLPDTIEIFDHLEIQGYLCFHYKFINDMARYWFEHPARKSIAVIDMDIQTGEIREKTITTNWYKVYQDLVDLEFSKS